MKPVHDRLYRRMVRLVADCRSAGLIVVADASNSGEIRLISKDEYGDGSDLRGLGRTVIVDNACGGGSISRRSVYGDE